MLTDELIKISLSKLERLFLVRDKKFLLTDRVDDLNDSCLERDENSSINLAEFKFEYEDQWDPKKDHPNLAQVLGRTFTTKQCGE